MFSVMPSYRKYFSVPGCLALILAGSSCVLPSFAQAADPIVTSFQVAEKANMSGDANNISNYDYTFLGASGMTLSNNRADWVFQQNGKKLTSTDYVCIAHTADGFRKHTANPSDYAVTAVYHTSNGWTFSTVRASDKVEEIPNNFSALYIPKTSNLKTGSIVTTTQAAADLKSYFAEGNFTAMDGVLIACGGLTESNVTNNFSWNPHYNIYASLDTANNGFIINASNTDGATTTSNNYTMNYAFIPHGTEGTVTGSAVMRQTSGTNCIFTYGGEGYTIEYIRAGEFKLTLDDYSAADGILMINGMTDKYNNQKAGDYSHDNIYAVSLTDDQKSFLIKSLDMNNDRVFSANTELQNGAFSFAFVAYDATLKAPETGFYRSGFDPAGKDYAGSLIEVSDITTSSSFTNRNLRTNELSSPYISVSNNNTADYNLFVNGKDFSNSNGIFITTTAQNDAPNIPQVFIDGDHAAISTVNISGQETDSSVAFGYFPVSSNQWVANSVTNSGTLTKRSSAAASLAAVSNGVQNYRIDGVDSRTDGILLATGRTNNAKYLISASPQSDGSWDLNTYEADTGALSMNSYDLLFLPYGDENGGFISGWIDGETGSANSSFGYFDLEKHAEGVFELSIGENLSADDGFLLLGLAGDENGDPYHGLISYEVTDDATFMINIRALDAAHTLADADFMFAFLSTSGKLQEQVPEPSTWALLMCAMAGIGLLRRKR